MFVLDDCRNLWADGSASGAGNLSSAEKGALSETNLLYTEEPPRKRLICAT